MEEFGWQWVILSVVVNLGMKVDLDTLEATSVSKKGKKARSFPWVGFSCGTLVVFFLGIGFVMSLIYFGESFGSIRIAANAPVDVRNAQNLASVFSSAAAAGSEEVKAVDSVWAAVSVLARGTYGSDSFSRTVFTVPDISEAELRAAMKHLRWEQGKGMIFDRDHGLELVDTEPPPKLK